MSKYNTYFKRQHICPEMAWIKSFFNCVIYSWPDPILTRRPFNPIAFVPCQCGVGLLENTALHYKHLNFCFIQLLSNSESVLSGPKTASLVPELNILCLFISIPLPLLHDTIYIYMLWGYHPYPFLPHLPFIPPSCYLLLQ